MGRPPSITDQQRAEVRRLADEGLSLRQIAAQVKTSKDTVRRTLAPAARPRLAEPVGVPEPEPAPAPTSATHRPPEVAEPRSERRLGLQPMTEADHWEMDRDRARRPPWLGRW